MPIFAWNVLLVFQILLKRSLVFSVLIVFIYFFAFITEAGFLIFLCYSLELCFQKVYVSFSLLPLDPLLLSSHYKASSDNHFALLHFFFLGMVLITASCTMSWTSIHSSSGTLSIRSNPLNLFVTSRRRRGKQRMRWLDGITNSGHGFGWTLGVADGQGGLLCCSSWCCKDRTRLSDWTELNWLYYSKGFDLGHTWMV